MLDMGTDGPASVDYPLFAAKVALAIQSGEADFGPAGLRNGPGHGDRANKFAGIRAAIVSDEPIRRAWPAGTLTATCFVSVRGCLGLGAATRCSWRLAWRVYEGERHQRRVDMIGEFEAEC